MKTTFLFFSFLLSAFSTIPLHVASQPVLDTAGNEVLPGVNYYILPTNHRNGGGLVLTGPVNGTCPLEIVQTPNKEDLGFFLTLSSVNPNDNVIELNTDLNIRFQVAILLCDESLVWRLVPSDAVPGSRVVGLGGVEGNPGRETLSSWFKIQKNGDSYNLQFCPTVCLTCGRVICRDIGIVRDNNGRRRLALSDEPFKIVFQRV